MNQEQTSFPLVSIVMLSFNRRSEVLYGLARMREIDYPALEIVVVDNASADDTVERVRAAFPAVRLIALEKNIGVAAANRGFSTARGEYLVIVDDDSFPLTDSISRMVDRFEKDPKIGVVAFNVRNVNHFNPASDRLISPMPDPSYRLGFNGAGAGFRREVVERCGGYSDQFFLYWNELDMALRIINQGYLIVWDEEIVVLHHYSPQNRASTRAPFFYTRNLLWIYWQYWPVTKLLFVRIPKLLFACLFHAFEQRSTIYLKAFFSGLFKLGTLPRSPVKPGLIKSLRLTEKLAFIYFR